MKNLLITFLSTTNEKEMDNSSNLRVISYIVIHNILDMQFKLKY